MLTLLCVFCAVAALELHSVIGEPGGVPAIAAAIALHFAPATIALWVRADAHGRGRQLPLDFEAMVFFTWFISAPIYVLRTRGWRGLGVILVFLVVYIAAAVAGFVLGYPFSAA